MFVVLFSLLLSAGLPLSFADKIVTVRVKSSLKTMTLAGQHIVCCSKGKKSPEAQSGNYVITYRRIDGLSYWQVYNPDSQMTKMYNGRKIFISGQNMHFGQVKVPRFLELYANKNHFDVIAHMNLEDYLRGVLPSEMPASWHLEALKAQAVASRSYTLAKIKRSKNRHYALESTVNDQVFDLNKENLVSARYRKKVHAAIKETAGIVLTSSSGNIYKSYYHADCGGETEEPHHVWSFKASNGTAKDPYCPSKRNSQWKAIFSHQKIAKIFKKTFKSSEQDVFQDLLVLNKSPSGRVLDVKVKFKNKDHVISAQRMRELLGYSKMKSTLFAFNKGKSSIEIKGRGNGHGVGLCQWGAKHWAESGKSFKEILSHYYPKAVITQL